MSYTRYELLLKYEQRERQLIGLPFLLYYGESRILITCTYITSFFSFLELLPLKYLLFPNLSKIELAKYQFHIYIFLLLNSVSHFNKLSTSFSISVG